MFNKILIANRGEIACRIARTAREMGIQTVAVYSDADQNALHVSACDEAVYIGGSAPSESYLLADKIIQTALDTGAQAIHPGFGFLSENADFAEACAANNLTFIGPGAQAIRSMGSKSAARQIMQKAGVPVLPGYDETRQDAAYLQKQAQNIGYPLLIKAVAGGGGKGLRAVSHADDFIAALEAVKRESLGAFADDNVLLERYLPVARHIEIQLFADTQGNVVHLFDRDCSMQRRHQKVIEEAPAPHISASVRAQMAQAAIACAKVVDYVGAGTVEFLLAPDGQFYFMEMNTRLQVEHPVSEMISGQDLVAWQFKVASGQVLPLQQNAIQCHGHAIEARIYAENPEQNFLPSTGDLNYLVPPTASTQIRIDTGVMQGDTISPYYDPMIAKLICHGDDREQALRRLAAALQNFNIIGPHTNIRFLSTLCTHPKVIEGGYDTRFIEHHLDDLIDNSDNISKPVSALLAVSLFSVLDTIRKTSHSQAGKADPYSPWAAADNWRVGETAAYEIELQSADSHRVRDQIRVLGNDFGLSLSPSPRPSPPGEGVEGARIIADARGNRYVVHIVSFEADKLVFSINGIQYQAIVIHASGKLSVLIDGRTCHYTLVDHDSVTTSDQSDKGSIFSPMPGKIIACHVKAGQSVRHSQTLMVVEAMKMEHAITAPCDGTIEAIHFEEGDQVADGDKLLSLIEADET